MRRARAPRWDRPQAIRGESPRPSLRFTAMNASTPLRIAIAAVLLPTLAFAAGGKNRKKSAPAPAPKMPEVLKTFDKNGNHQIDSDELADLQKTFSELRKLDK